MATLSIKTLFKMGDGGETEAFTLVPRIKQIGTIGDEAPLVDVTTLEDEGKEYISGIIDGQEIEIVGNYEKDDSQQTLFRTAAKNRTKHNFEIAYNNGVTASLNLVLLGFKMNEPDGEGALTFTVKAKQNGLTTWTEA
jgi:hypothetical protein